jgi:uncharacterized membrane protein YjjP (DUF1212 family)
MARRRTTQAQDNRKRRGRKSQAEESVERTTWFLLVLIFAVLYIFPEENVPNWIIPVAGAFVLLGSGVYQYSRRWHVSPITWIAGTIMLILAMVNLYVSPEQDFFGFALLTFAVVIGVGVITGET